MGPLVYNRGEVPVDHGGSIEGVFVISDFSRDREGFEGHWEELEDLDIFEKDIFNYLLLDRKLRDCTRHMDILEDIFDYDLE